MTTEKRVDEDWKRRAQAEKETDSLKAAAVPATQAKGATPLKDAKASPHFAGLVESLASQALMFMGAIRDPMSGAAHQDFGQAQAMIDILQMMEEKTQGNLAKEENEMLRQALDEVRMHFVRLSQPPPAPRSPMMGNKAPGQ
jgi:hypothetical protein